MDKLKILSIVGVLEKELQGFPFEKQILGVIASDVLTFNTDLRINYFALGMRELIANLLRSAAPDKQIVSCHWFSKEKPTRSDRFHYWALGGLPGDFVGQEAYAKFRVSVKDIISQIDEMSKWIHFEKDRIGLKESILETMITDVLNSIIGIIKAITTVNKVVKNEIIDRIYETIEEEVTREVPSEIDALATHACVEEVSNIQVSDIKLYSDSIWIKGRCNLECELQYGSNSDIRNDIGAVNSHTAYGHFICDGEIENGRVTKIHVSSIEYDPNWGDEPWSPSF